MKRWMAATLCGLLMAGATAQDKAHDNAPGKVAAESGRVHQLYRGSRIIGSAVRDARQQKIGEIKDIVLDSARGDIAYAIVQFRNVPGAGKYRPVPWQALEPADNGAHYVLHADRETIGQAPAFDRNHWPDMDDQRWSADVDRYWSRTVGRAPGSGNRLSTDAGRAGGARSDRESSGR